MLSPPSSVTPIGGWAVAPALADPVALLAGIGVGVSLVGDPLRRRPARDAQLPRATYALMVALLPATATVIGVVVLAQVPSAAELAGVALVVAGVALHRAPAAEPEPALNRHDPDRRDPGRGE